MEPVKRQPVWRLLAYGAPAFGLTFCIEPLNAFLPAAIAQTTGISLGAAGLAFAVGRVWDAVVDPAIGAAADRGKGAWSRRKLWVLGGCICAPACLWLATHLPTQTTFLGLVGALIALYTAYSIAQIPLYAWGAEISPDYGERTRIAAFRESLTLAAGVTVPLLPILFLQGGASDPAQVIQLFGLAGLVLLIPCGLVSVYVGPNPRLRLSADPGGNLWRTLQHNPPLRRFLFGVTSLSLAYNCFNSGMLFLTAYALGIPQAFLPLVLARGVVAFLTIPLIVQAAQKLGKHIVMVIGSLTMTLSFALLYFAPREDIFVAATAYIVMGAMVSAVVVAPSALLADVADYGRLRTGADDVAGHFAAMTFSQKFAAAVGPALILPMLEFGGFEIGAAYAEETAQWVRFCTLVPAGLIALAGACAFWKFPIDARRHGIIRRRLAQRRSTL